MNGKKRMKLRRPRNAQTHLKEKENIYTSGVHIVKNSDFLEISR
jgi:hypothetical protein